MRHKRLFPRTIAVIAAPLSVVLLLGSCQSLADLAPPVAADDVRFAQLSVGRDVYITDCARCHSPEPVSGYTAGEWRGILDRMQEKVTLSPSEWKSLEAYIRVFARASESGT